MSDLDLFRFLPESLARLSAYNPPEGNYRVRLDANESPYPPDPAVMDEIGKALESMPLNRYPDPGSKGLRNAFADRFGCPAENVMAGNGSDELIGLLMWTLRGNQQQSQPAMIVPTPTFAMYSITARAVGYEVFEVPLDAGLKPDMDAMLRAVNEKRPSIVFISNPNNPTGTSYTKKQIQQLLEASTGLVVIDEAYGDFTGDTSWTSEVTSISNLAVLRTLSKVGGAALRCGFLAAGSGLLQEVNKVRSPFNLSRYTQIAGEAFLRNYDLVRSQVADVIRERDRLSGQLKDLGLQIFPSRGNFLFVQCGGKEEALWRFLQENSIVVKFLASLPVTGDALRITVGSQEENDLLLSRTRDFLAEGGTNA